MSQRAWILTAVLLGLLGCNHGQTKRLQSEEEPETKDRYEVKTLGDVTTFDNANPVQVSWVGLVRGLDGTGGGAPPGPYRAQLEKDLLRRGDEKGVKKLLNSPDVSLVLVTALVPPGARKGDPVDLEVTLPDGSRTSSLRGGYLEECVLYNYDTAKNLNPNYAGPDRPLMGDPWVRAKGPLLVGLGDGDEQARERQGRVWGGGTVLKDLPFYLLLNPGKQSARLAGVVAERINETFHGPVPALSKEVAEAKTNVYVQVKPPPHYKHNLPRFLRVVRLIPLRESPDNYKKNRFSGGARDDLAGDGVGSPYRKRLEKDLLDPAWSITAALRLEALGAASAPTLKQGLASEHVLVRFTSAEALAYLNNTNGAEELTRLIETQPALRAYCLTALASLPEAISYLQLRELLRSNSPEVRYGAFRALRALKDQDPGIAGEYLNDSFWVHRVVPGAEPLVHVSSTRRAEVVLFGEEPRLVAPFSILSGEFTVTATEGDDRCTVTRISVHRGRNKQQCSLAVAEVLRVLGDMGGTYPDAVEVLRQAHRQQGLSCRLEVDALPQATSVYEIARAGRKGGDDLGVEFQTDEEILKAKADFGATPNLYEKATAGRRTRSSILAEEEAALRDRRPREDGEK